MAKYHLGSTRLIFAKFQVRSSLYSSTTRLLQNKYKRFTWFILWFFFAKQKQNKEVFVKHEKAPTASRLERVKWISRICPCFGKSQLLGIFGQLPVAESVKRNIFTPRPFIWTYSHVSTTIRYRGTAWKKIMFRKTAVFKTFRKFQPTSGNPMWPQLPNGIPHAKSFLI